MKADEVDRRTAGGLGLAGAAAPAGSGVQGGATHLTEPEHSPAGQASAIWLQALGDLRLQMTRATYDTNLADTWAVAWDPVANAWTIGVRRPHTLGWLRHRLDPLIRRALVRRTPGLPVPEIAYVVATPPPPARPARDCRLRAARPDPDPPAAGAGSEPLYHGPTLDSVPPCAVSEPNLPPGRPVQAARPNAARAHRDLPPNAPATEAQRSRPAPASTLGRTDYYIKLKIAFRDRALRRLKGARLSVFISLACHQDRQRISAPGVDRIMRETGLARSTVCRALDELASPRFGLVEKLPARRRAPDRYRILGYAWYGSDPAPALYEEEEGM